MVKTSNPTRITVSGKVARLTADGKTRRSANGGNAGKGSKWCKPAVRLAIYIRDNFTCLYCGKDLRLSPKHLVSLDHIVPRSEGGSHNHDNLITACTPCNSARLAKTVEEYAPGGALKRIKKQVAQEINLSLAKAIIAGKAGDPRSEAQRANR